MEEKDFKNIVVTIMVIALFVLAFLIVKPIIISILFGLILAYVFNPLYRKLHKNIKSKNLCATILVCGILIILLVLAVFFTPVLIRQMSDVYNSIQKVDLYSILINNLPESFQPTIISADISAAMSSSTTALAGLIRKGVENLIFNIPTIFLYLAVTIFSFFFVLRDYDDIREYIRSISPLGDETNKKFYQKFEQITNSIIYGELLAGISQGLSAGIAYFIFGVPNALLLTLLTTFAGIIPVFGAWIVWAPAAIYLFLSGHVYASMGLFIYCILVVSSIDNVVRLLVISKMAKMNTALSLIGMIGGLFVFGLMGLIIGPLVLAYLLLVIEFYKERKFKSILLQEPARSTQEKPST